MRAPIDAPGNPTRWSAMRLTKATLDQVQILVLVARSQADIISVSDVAVQLSLTKPNALKLVTRLVRTGVLRAKRGPGGGVKLGRPASQILLGHVVSQLESINAKDHPQEDRKSLSKDRLADYLDLAFAAFIELLNQHTLADLAARNSKLPAMGKRAGQLHRRAQLPA